MEITSNISMIKAKSGEIIIVINDSRVVVEPTNAYYSRFASLYHTLFINKSQRPLVFQNVCANATINNARDFYDHITTKSPTVNTNTADANKYDPTIEIKDLISDLMNFFKEFEFEPSFRFLNTVARLKSRNEITSYILNYFELTDSPYLTSLKQKMKSAEFKAMVNKLVKIKTPQNIINNRFEIYYGSAGTGKTTKAMSLTDNRVMVCNSSMLPSDLIKDFTFDDGKANFHPSILVECMEKGLPICLDEINLLPFDSLRFLQGVLDNKSEFNYDGVTIHINDGFKIYGTMNLNINGSVFGLPNPLVDRGARLDKFELTPNMLVSAFD